MHESQSGGNMKKINILISILILVLSIGVGISDSLYSRPQNVREIKRSPVLAGIPAIQVTQPVNGAKWFLGQKYEIHYKLTNINTAHRVRLYKGKQYLGDFAGGNDIGTHSIKLAVTCGAPLLNGVKYTPGTDYQIEVATVDNKIKARSSGFFSILAKLLLKPNLTAGPVSQNPSLKIPLPDLTIYQVRFFKEDVFKAEVTVYNKGPADSAPCVLELKVGCGSFKTVTVGIPALKKTVPGAWPDIKSQKTVIIKSPYAFHTSMSIFTIDAGKVVTENDEGNNTWQKDNCIK
jgi:hypothetical protein